MEKQKKYYHDRRNESRIDEKKVLAEIEESFCVAGYDIIQSTVFRESIAEHTKQA